jgi:hypothetical protein
MSTPHMERYGTFAFRVAIASRDGSGRVANAHLPSGAPGVSTNF